MKNNIRVPLALCVGMAWGVGATICEDKDTQISPETVPVGITAVDTEIGAVKTEVDWACDKYLSFTSDGEYVAATKDCTEMTDITGQIRGVDPSLAAADLRVVDYNAGDDELLVGDGVNLWTVSGLFDYVEELPNAKVTGKRVKVEIDHE